MPTSPSPGRAAPAGAIGLIKPEAWIGADTDKVLGLKDGFGAAHHARLRWDGAGWRLEDLGSKNGTFVNGERVLSGTTPRAALGSKLRLGDMVLELQG